MDTLDIFFVIKMTEQFKYHNVPNFRNILAQLSFFFLFDHQSSFHSFGLFKFSKLSYLIKKFSFAGLALENKTKTFI